MSDLRKNNPWEKVKESGSRITFKIPDFENVVNKEFVKTLRNELNYTQNVFANAIGVRKKTIEKWEQGINPVVGPTARLLYLINDDKAILSKIYSADFIDYTGINEPWRINTTTLSGYYELSNTIFLSSENSGIITEKKNNEYSNYYNNGGAEWIKKSANQALTC